MQGRIAFAGNPWPKGHALEELSFAAEIEDDQVTLAFSLETADYEAEDDGDDEDDEAEGEGDWTSKIVWGNYHACTMRGRVPVEGKLDLAALSGQEIHVDPITPDYDPEEGHFETYLLGHDSVADHRITLTGGPAEYSLYWTGKIALTYAGDDEFKHAFALRAEGVPFDGIYMPDGVTDEASAREVLAQHVSGAEGFEFVQQGELYFFKPPA
jgi:hypothetical protein